MFEQKLIDTIPPQSHQIAWTLISAVLLYRVGIIIHRLYFHKLSKFPGPKLAAASTLYRAYFQIWRDGDHVAQATRLHETYGRWLILREMKAESHVFLRDEY